MGRYLRGNGEGKLQQDRDWGGFDSPSQLVHFLSKTRKDDPRWQHVTHIAQEFLDERKVPRYRVRKNDLRNIVHHHPIHLGGDVMHEWHASRQGRHKGAGLFDAFTSLFYEAKHYLGIDKLQEWIGLGPKHIPMTDSEKDVARAVDQSYKSVKDRKKKVGKLVRVPEYDTDRIAVWKESSGQLLVTVHGSSLGAHDIGQDMQIMVGKQIKSKELETLLQDLNDREITYDLAGHSLATTYIQSAVTDGFTSGADDIFLFNPASSGFQDGKKLREYANDDRYTYFIDEGDLVSQALYQNMNRDTMNNRVRLKYRYDPVSAHSMSQWVPKDEEEAEEEEDEKEDEEEAPKRGGWTVHWKKDDGE